MGLLTMPEVDELLGVPGGTSNYLRGQGLFEAEKTGRMHVIYEEQLPDVAEVVRQWFNPPGWTIEETAVFLDISPGTVYSLIRNGLLTKVGRNRKPRIDPDSAKEYRLTRRNVRVKRHKEVAASA